MKTYKCLYCNKENLFGRSKINKYCNNACQGLYKWQYETVPKIENGTSENISVSTLKKYLFKVHGEKCSLCDQSNIHNNKPLVLQMDHIDGNSDNNQLTNLRLLCPNCHTQTINFGCKGLGNRYKKVTKRNKYLQNYKTPGGVER